MIRFNNKINNLFFSNDIRKDHSKALDGLRGLAVLIVLLAHSSNTDLFFHELLNFKKAGKIGVYLFFVLSAYLLDKQIIEAYQNKKTSYFFWKNYILRRFLRIYPLFFISLLIYLTLEYSGIINNEWTLKRVLAHLILKEGWHFYWSISVEFKYYILSPILLMIIHKYFKWNIKYTISFISIITFASILLTIKLGLSYLSIVRYLPIFLTGTAIAIFEVKRPDEFSRTINNKGFKYAGILALAIILLSIPYYFKLITGQTIDNRLAYYYLPYAILFGIILYSAKRNTGIIRNILEVKMLRFLGIISFSLYIFHMLILRIITKLNTPESYKIYIFFILAIIISSISYIFIEKPLSKIKIIKRMPLNVYKCANNNDI